MQASSNSRRLKPYGLFSQLKIYAPDWFLNAKDDINSSYFLEDIATEFDVQGLEVDWSCVAWDADMQYKNGEWVYKIFRGKNWQNLSDIAKIAYKKNAYRVLLTRARHVRQNGWILAKYYVFEVSVGQSCHARVVNGRKSAKPEFYRH